MHLIELIEEKKIAVIYVETSGSTAKDNYIIAIGAVRVEGWKKEEQGGMAYDPNITALFKTLVHCPVSLSPEITELTGITDNDLKNAPSTDVALAKLKQFIGSDMIVCYNQEFNYSFLSEHGGRCGITFDNPGLDLLQVAKSIYRDKIRDYSIWELAGLTGTEFLSDNALDYAITLANLLCHLALRDDEAHCKY